MCVSNVLRRRKKKQQQQEQERKKNLHKTDHIIFGYENSRNAHRLS